MAAQNALTQIITATLPTAVREIEVRSAFSPPTVINVQDALKPPAPGKQPTLSQRAAGFLQPTIIMRGGSLGQQVIAPYGAVDAGVWKRNLAFAGGALFLGGLAVGALFFAAGRRTARR